MSFLLRGVESAILWYFFLLNACYLVLFLVAFREVRLHRRGSAYEDLDELFSSPLTPPVSVVVPARDEAVGIVVSVGGLLRLDYPRYEVIVVNDGSADATLAALIAAFTLVPDEPEPGGTLPSARVRAVYRSSAHENLRVIDKEPGGKSDALNAGLNAARHPYFCSVDADDVLEPDALLRLMRHVLESPVRVVGIGGVVRVANGCRVEKGRVAEIDLSPNPLAVFQVIEYFRAFLGARMGFSRMNGLMILSGAFALFETDAVVAAGGYRTDTVGEDMELVTRLHRRLRDGGERGYGILFVADPVCWTEVPRSLRVLARQRRRWQRGLLEVLGRNLGMFADQRYGAVGVFTLPFLLVFEGWGVLLEVLGYALFMASLWRGSVDRDFMLAFFAIAVFCGAALSLAGVLMGEIVNRRYPGLRHMLALMLFAFLENLCYRPATAVMRLWGLIEHVLKSGSWGRMERSGLG